MKLSNMKIGLAALWLANLAGPMLKLAPDASVGDKALNIGIAITFGLLATLNLVEAIELRAKEREEAKEENK